MSTVPDVVRSYRPLRGGAGFFQVADVDDSSDYAPRTPGVRAKRLLPDNGYKELIKSYVGLNRVPSPTNALFGCAADRFFYDITNGQIVLRQQSTHDLPRTDYASYAFNGGNLETNLGRFGLDYTRLGIAGRTLGSIKSPARTVLLFEHPAGTPFSWHRPKLPLAPENWQFNDAMDTLSFVDGHVSFTKIYWTEITTNGCSLNALQEDPPPGYAYQWSGD